MFNVPNFHLSKYTFLHKQTKQKIDNAYTAKLFCWKKITAKDYSILICPQACRVDATTYNTQRDTRNRLDSFLVPDGPPNSAFPQDADILLNIRRPTAINDSEV